MDVEEEEMEVDVQEQQEQDSKADALPPPPVPAVVPEISQLPWIEKYRPKSLSELIAHDEIITICKHSCMCKNPITPHPSHDIT
jgi:hypothetical protein